MKKRRKVERVQPARVLVSEEVERFRSAYGPEEHLPEDFNVQHNVNNKRLATVIHERDQIDKPECSAGGVPLDLIRYPVTTDHDGNIVTEQLIYEFEDFTAFIRVQNLIYLMTMPAIGDGTFDGTGKLKGYDPRASQIYNLCVKFEVTDSTFTFNVGVYPQFVKRSLIVRYTCAAFIFLKLS